MKQFGTFILALLFIYLIVGLLPSNSEWQRDLIIYSTVIILLMVVFSVKGTKTCPLCRSSISYRKYLYKSDNNIFLCPYCGTKLKAKYPFPGWFRLILYLLIVSLIISAINFIPLSSRLSNMVQGLIAILFPVVYIRSYSTLEKQLHAEISDL